MAKNKHPILAVWNRDRGLVYAPRWFLASILGFLFWSAFLAASMLVLHVLQRWLA
jgi:hypothetical protein